jgi:hypothetical protein
MPSRSSFRLTPPQQVYDTYTAIRNSPLLQTKTLTDETIMGFQQSLNAAQPQSDEEAMSRSLIQYLYRKNPVNFCRFLERSRLNHLILWTEAKCIVSHFNLRGVVYVKWNDDHYECSLHRNRSNTDFVSEHPALNATVAAVGEFKPVRNNRRDTRRGRGGSRRGGNNFTRGSRHHGPRAGYDVNNFPTLPERTQTPFPSPEGSTPSSVSGEDAMAQSIVIDAPVETSA